MSGSGTDLNPAGEQDGFPYRGSVAALRLEDAAWLGRWRAKAELEVCVLADRIWIRGPEPRDWERLPAIARYVSGEGGRLTLLGKRLPSASMPDGPWQALSDFLPVQPPGAFLPAQSVFPIAWSLVRSEEVLKPRHLLVDFEKFLSWGLLTESWRLDGLRFARCQDGRALVSGEPLPTLPGQFWGGEEEIACPAGWDLPRGVTLDLVREMLAPQKGEIVLIHEDCSCERISSQAFVPVTRSNLRATCARESPSPKA